MFCDLRKAFDTRLIMEFYWANFKKKGIRRGETSLVSRLFVLYAQSSLHYTFADETTLLLSGPNIKIDNLIARANLEFKKVTDFIEPTNYCSTPS